MLNSWINIKLSNFLALFFFCFIFFHLLLPSSHLNIAVMIIRRMNSELFHISLRFGIFSIISFLKHLVNTLLNNLSVVLHSDILLCTYFMIEINCLQMLTVLFPSLTVLIPFISFYCHVTWAMTLSTMLNKSGSWNTCLVLNLKRKTFNISLLNILLTIIIFW